MNDHVAVLRELRERAASGLRLAQGRAECAESHARVAALDHAIAAVAERGALVARLGEARDLLSEAKFDLDELREQQILPRKRAPFDRQIEQIEAWLAAADLARVVKEGGG